jgi:hypothetical protein
MGRHGEDLRPAAHQQDLVVADMAGELSVTEVCERDTLGQIGARRRGLVFGHLWSP